MHMRSIRTVYVVTFLIDVYLLVMISAVNSPRPLDANLKAHNQARDRGPTRHCAGLILPLFSAPGTWTLMMVPLRGAVTRAVAFTAT